MDGLELLTGGGRSTTTVAVVAGAPAPPALDAVTAQASAAPSWAAATVKVGLVAPAIGERLADHW